MLSSLTSKAILSKARAIYKNRITLEEYNELLRKHSVTEVAAFLKAHPGYSGCLAPYNENLLHRGQLEAILQRNLFYRYTGLCRFEHEPGDGFYRYYIIHSEILEILECIRLLSTGKSEQYILSLPAFLISHASFKLMSLASVRSYADLLVVLERTPYYNILKPFSPVNGQSIDFTACEVALKKFYYQSIFSLIDNNFHGETKKELYAIFMQQAELYNILVILRTKAFFHYTPEYINSCLLPYSHLVSQKKIRQMVDAPDLKTASSILHTTHYAKNQRESEDDDFFEITGRHITYHQVRHYLRFSIAAPVVLCSFIILSEIELSNIFNIVEGIRYHISPSEIEQLLVY